MNSRYTTSSAFVRGRDYYPTSKSTSPLKPSDVVPTATYMERGQRWMEKEEAHSLRDAMDDMTIRESPEQKPSEDDETRLYNAALDEAAELVWKHQNGVKPPEPDAPYRYRPHLRKNSYAHARTASIGPYGDGVAASGLARDELSRSASASSSDDEGQSRINRPSIDSSRSQDSRNAKSYGGMNNRPGSYVDARRRSSMRRNISGEVERPFSGDQIWEEPENSSIHGSVNASGTPIAALSSKPDNSRVRFQATVEDVPDVEDQKPSDRVNIHRNAPSQSRNPLYTTNTPSPAARPSEDVERKNGMEVRSQELREATTRSLKDRSGRLPEPTAVSDSPGRPIVSFNANWKAPDESTDSNPDRRRQAQQQYQAASAHGRSRSGIERPQSMGIPSISVAEEDPSPLPGVPSISVGAVDNTPRIPTINVPTIAVDDAPGDSNVPVIVTPDDNNTSGGPRPLPTPGAAGQRARRAQRPRGHWSPAPGTTPRVNAICHECSFPIEGRFVALRGAAERFHPQCFRCYTCGTGLEAMEISHEPDQMRAERLDRIRRREAGERLPETPGETEDEDGDDRLRFFCHLDWHELFAPRCKHCRTPILGEHVVALGHHWHFGHFFCAECGDPFEHGMTHIEKDGYAWCINCQTKRTERRAPKCRMCRTAVIGNYIQALGYEWHEHCFRCAECRGGFDDGQIFPKEVPEGTIVLCTKCRAMELKL